ncbi:glycoside hydrolase family 32 protein [Coniochaeta sp. 2T2.1]|nr:glycoside hydrolase family 32 protein [Coniochaeta sp. 2T2.1]
MAVLTAPAQDGGILPKSRLHHENKPVDAFQKWRPGFHLMPASNWANDPCGPGYIGGRFYTSFQWNPHGWEWGNMSWGHALSEDLVHWHVSKRPSMEPSAEDPCGVFTGCVWPSNPRGEEDGTLTAIYTSAQHAPIHYTMPYTPGSEVVRMATSSDLGKTWQRQPGVVLAAPKAIDVIGWRDPFIGRWECLGDSLYGVIAGGIRQKSPAVFLYRVDPHDLSCWDFDSILFAPGLNFQPHPSLDFGTNFEVTNFMTLRDNTGKNHEVLLMSVEGGRKEHSQNWVCGEISANTLEYRFGGCLDHGCFYAANSFIDPSGQRIVQGWVTEHLPPVLTEKQRWSGCLSLPRILGMRQIREVTQAPDWLHWVGETVTVLTSIPDPRVEKLRRRPLDTVEGRHLEVKASFEVDDTEVGIVLHHGESRTVVSFHPSEQLLSIKRHGMFSNMNGDECAPHSLLKVRDQEETLDIHLFFDVSVLEVFVNERLAITTRVYPENARCTAVRPFGNSGEPKVVEWAAWELGPSITYE